MFAQNTFCPMFQLEKAEIEQPHSLRVLIHNFDQQFDYSWQRGSRMFIAFQAAAELAAHANSPESRFRGCPEQISFSGEMTEYCNLTYARQARDFVRAAS